MITAEHLAKRYRKKVAVDDVSFNVETGKVTGFLGPNGAGKSTTMRLMLGLDSGAGSTLYDGKPLHGYARPSQVVGILLEAKAFHPTRSARQHLRILANAGSISTHRVEEVLDIVGLQDVAKRKPGKFSLGMAQRLGIAAAILGQPKYLILDEPANGLDPEGIAWLRQFLKDYADAGNAVFVSSHLLSEMSQMADNIVVIGKGKLIASTSMNALVSGDKHAGVLVRTPDNKQLKQLLQQHKLTFSPAENGIIVTGITSDELGDMAFDAKIRLYELTPQKASLEQAFLDLTEGSEEFRGKGEGK